MQDLINLVNEALAALERLLRGPQPEPVPVPVRVPVARRRR